jgi:hypothetical protein
MFGSKSDYDGNLEHGQTMPRANRHFLPGHVWHITMNSAAASNRSVVPPLCYVPVVSNKWISETSISGNFEARRCR